MIGGFFAEYVGYRPSFYVGSALMLLDFFLVLFLVKEEKAAPRQANDNAGRSKSLLSLFTPVISVMLLVLLFQRIGRNVVNPYLPLFVQEILVKGEGAARMTGVISGVTGFMTALSAMTISRLGDRCDKLTLLTVLGTISLILSIPLFFLGEVWSFTILYAALFFIAGGMEPILSSITAENTLPERRGALFGIQGTIGSIGMALAPMLGGFLSIRFSLHAIFLALPAFLLLTLSVLLALRFRRVKEDTADPGLPG